MRLTPLGVVMVLLWSVPGLSEENPVTNGGFEVIGDDGVPVDWQTLGEFEITQDAHSGNHAVALFRDSREGLCGLNRVWTPDNGEQGTMLSELKGGIRFWYKAEQMAPDASLVVEIIPMSERPWEDTGAMRVSFSVPDAHVGDGRWHEGAIKYDFTDQPKVKWVHISPRLRGDAARMVLDDFSWVDSVGPLPLISELKLEEVAGKEGDECFVRAAIKNTGDRPVGIGLASIALPEGLYAQAGLVRGIKNLSPDVMQNVSWHVTGRRIDKGSIRVALSAGEHKSSAKLDYEPELEVLGLTTERFILCPGEPTGVTLRLRNTGHAMARDVRADIRPGVPLTTQTKARQRSLERIRPQTEAELTWDISADSQAPDAYLRVNVQAGNCYGGRATTRLVIGAPPPAEGLWSEDGVQVEDEYAAIYNDHVRLLYPKAQFGYGIGILQRRVKRAWETVGMLPRLSRLVVAADGNARQAEHLVYAQTAAQIPSPEAVAPQMLERKLQFTGEFTDANGTGWTFSQIIVLGPQDSRFTFDLQAVPDAPAQVLAMDGPMFYAGEGAAEGTRRLDALFPGLEWLVEGEQSSSTLDIAAEHPHRVRYVPHPHMVTIPVMTTRLAPPVGNAATVCLMWDHLAPYYGTLNRPSAAFASPDVFEGHSSTLMGLFVPSMPEYIEPNERVAHAPMQVAAKGAVRLTAQLSVLEAPPGDTSLEAVKLWAAQYGVPEPNALPHGKTLSDEVAFSMPAYLSSLWIPDEEKWYPSMNGPALWHKAMRSPAYLYDMRMYLDMTPEGELRDLVQQRYDRVVELSGLTPQADDLGLHYSGPVDGFMNNSAGVVATIRSQREDGSWRFRARIETSGVFEGMDYAELGEDDAAEVGTCARNAWMILRFARMTGDKDAREAGLKALAFMDRFKVPRAAQVWEVPVHTPDILASSDACEAYTEAYKITGKQHYLDQAVYWAWTGLPFLYMWDTEGFEFLKYASIPVFGATWFQGSWFGRPVQWNGLRYAYALLDLARYDDSLDWEKIGRGVTISCMYQQSTQEEDLALWPDSISAIDRTKSGWIFAPRGILQNVYGMMGMDPTPNTAVAKVAFDPVYINAAGKISDTEFSTGTLSFKVTYTPPQQGYVLLCNATKPERVLVAENVAAEVDVPEDADAPCWRYVEAAGLLELRLPGPGAHEVRLSNVTYQQSRFMPETATELAFEFETDDGGWRPTNDLGAFSVRDGVLHATTAGSDPYMVRANCDAQAGDVAQLRIRMSLQAGLAGAGQVFWATSESPSFDEPKSMAFLTTPDGEFHEYTVPVSDSDLWTGDITAIRIDPTGGAQVGSVKIDYIRGE